VSFRQHQALSARFSLTLSDRRGSVISKVGKAVAALGTNEFVSIRKEMSSNSNELEGKDSEKDAEVSIAREQDEWSITTVPDLLEEKHAANMVELAQLEETRSKLRAEKAEVLLQLDLHRQRHAAFCAANLEEQEELKAKIASLLVARNALRLSLSASAR